MAFPVSVFTWRFHSYGVDPTSKKSLYLKGTTPRSNAHFWFFLPAKDGETHNPFINSLYLFASVKTGSEYLIFFQRFEWYPFSGNCLISEASTVPWISIVKIPRMSNQCKTIFSTKTILKSIHYVWKKSAGQKIGCYLREFRRSTCRKKCFLCIKDTSKTNEYNKVSKSTTNQSSTTKNNIPLFSPFLFVKCSSEWPSSDSSPWPTYSYPACSQEVW